MSFDAAYIDQIVQSVLSEIRSQNTSGGVASVAAPKATAVAAAPQPVNAAPLVIRERVISESVLVTAQAAGRTVSLLQGAVITPSGRDYIRKNRVTLSSGVGSAAVSVTGLVISLRAAATVSAAASATGWKTASTESVFAAAGTVIREFQTQPVVCIGDDSSVVACLVNRDTRVRAAVIGRPELVTTLTSVMNPNVWCIDGAGWSFADYQRLLRSVGRNAEKPTGWEEIAAGGPR
ncbi:MAG: hypothetical protein JNM43_01200 [Planctomycetaceae bacterium]|nr:hypothetical protein [Planctomycetaceae bacterium]